MSKEHSLSLIRLFAGLSEVQLSAIEAVGEFRNYEEGETIFAEGDEGTHLYAVTEGRVQLSVGLHGQTEQVPVHISTPGSVFGEFVLFEKLPRSATAQVYRGTGVFVVTAEQMETVFQQDPAAGHLVMRNLCSILVSRMRKTTSELRASLAW
jgi:CRP-like cAMP-binding protein